MGKENLFKKISFNKDDTINLSVNAENVEVEQGLNLTEALNKLTAAQTAFNSKIIETTESIEVLRKELNLEESEFNKKLSAEIKARSNEVLNEIDEEIASLKEVIDSNYVFALNEIGSIYSLFNSQTEYNKSNLVDFSQLSFAVDEINANKVTTDVLEANTAIITNLIAENAEITNLAVENLKAKDAEIENLRVQDLQAVNASIENLKTENLQAVNVAVENLKAENAEIVNASINDLKTNYLDANYAHITDGEIDNAKINVAKINDLSANYAKVDMANVNNTWINNGTIKNGAISSAMISELSANKITSGTLDASNITVTNLNADNITTGKLNGQLLNQGSVDLSSLSAEVPTKQEIETMKQELQDQIDGSLSTYITETIPTLNNYPANKWTTEEERRDHIGNICYVINEADDANGWSYRFTGSEWVQIKDSDVTALLEELKVAQGDISNLKTFETNTNTWKNTVDNEVTTIKNRTTTVETSLGDKLDKTTFKETVDGIEEEITTISSLSTQISEDLEITTSTANQAKQTADSTVNSLSQLKTTVDTNTGNITSTSSKLSEVEQDLSGFKQTVAETYATADSVSQLESNLTQTAEGVELKVTQGITTALGKNGNITNAISSAKSDAISTANTNAESSISNAVSAENGVIKKALDELDVKAKGYAGDAESNAATSLETFRTGVFKSTIDGVTQTLSETNTLIETKADGSTVTDLATRTSSLEQDLSGFKQTVAETYATADTLEEMQTSIEQNASNINLKVSSETFNAAKTELNKYAEDQASAAQTAAAGDATAKANAAKESAIQIAAEAIKSFVKTAGGETSYTQSKDGFSWTVSKTINAVDETARENAQSALEAVGGAVSSVQTEYYLSTSTTELIGGSWETEAPEWTENQYMWSRIKTTFTNDEVSYSPSENGTCIAGAKGEAGSTGEGVESIIAQYYLSSSKTEQIDGTWVEVAPTWEREKYLWSRNKITYKNPSSVAYTIPICDSSWEAVKDVETDLDNVKKTYSKVELTTEGLKITTGTSEMLTYDKDSLDDSFESVNGRIDNYDSYINISGDNITLGKISNSQKLKIENQKISFLDGTSELSAFKNNEIILGKTNKNHSVLNDTGFTLYDSSNNATATFQPTVVRLGRIASGTNNIWIEDNGIYLKNNTTKLASFTSTALTLGQTGTGNKNTYITKDGLYLRDNTTNIASFTPTAIAFGTSSATINMCNTSEILVQPDESAYDTASGQNYTIDGILIRNKTQNNSFLNIGTQATILKNGSNSIKIFKDSSISIEASNSSYGAIALQAGSAAVNISNVSSTESSVQFQGDSVYFGSPKGAAVGRVGFYANGYTVANPDKFRSAIGAGTGSSDLKIGTSSTTAAAGNHDHDSAYAAKSHTHASWSTPSVTNKTVSNVTVTRFNVRQNTALKLCTINGLIQTTAAGLLSGLTAIRVLPSDCRPAFNADFAVSSTSGMGRGLVSTGGEVQIALQSNAPKGNYAFSVTFPTA